MIHLFTGNDTKKVREKAFAFIAAARKKREDAPYMRLDADSITSESLSQASGAQGLFFSKTLVLLDDPFSQKEVSDITLSFLPALSQSQNLVVLLAPNTPPLLIKKVEPHSEKIYAFDTLKKQERGFNTALVNALSSRDGKTLWKEIVKAERTGEPAESVHGLLHWKARDMIQKKHREWTQEEARALSRLLINLMQDARQNNVPLTLALERFALSLIKP